MENYVLLIIVITLLFSAFFSGTEIAYYAYYMIRKFASIEVKNLHHEPSENSSSI